MSAAKMPRFNNKETRKFVKRALEGGAEYAGLVGHSHPRLRCPNGDTLTIPGSPSDRRWIRNATRDLRNAGVDI